MTPGKDFYDEAMRPAYRMLACLRTGNVGVALVHFQRLVAAFHAAVDRVCRNSGADRQTVMLLLHEKELEAAAIGTVEIHQRAAALWLQHKSSLIAVLGQIGGAVLDVNLGIGGSGLGEALGSVVNRALQDARVKGPLIELQQAFIPYDQWVLWCVADLNADVALLEGYARVKAAEDRRRRRNRLIAWTAAGLGPSAVGDRSYAVSSRREIPRPHANSSRRCQGCHLAAGHGAPPGAPASGHPSSDRGSEGSNG